MRHALLLLTFATFFPAAAAAPIDEATRLAEPPGNIAVTPEGQVFVSLHPFFSPKWRVVAVAHDGGLTPYPDEAWAGAAAGQVSLDSVLGIRVDSRGILWMLDTGHRGKTVPKVVAWDTKTNRLSRVIYLPAPVTPDNQFVNDLAVDEDHNALYIADPAGGGNAALIVVDLKTGNARRVLEGHKSVAPEDVDVVVDGRPVEMRRSDGSATRPRIGVNPITLDGRSEWLYFGPMSGRSLYRIRTIDLNDAKLSPDRLALQVERYADKPVCDGINIDDADNIYVTDVGANAIGVIGRDRKYRILLSDPRLSWPDALSFGPDGNLYAVANQLHLSPPLNRGDNGSKPPYPILRIKPLAPGRAGR